MREKLPRTSQWTIGQCTAELKSPLYTLPVQEVAYLENEMKTFMSKHVNLLKQAELVVPLVWNLHKVFYI
jgi:hypothetical protein